MSALMTIDGIFNPASLAILMDALKLEAEESIAGGDGDTGHGTDSAQQGTVQVRITQINS